MHDIFFCLLQISFHDKTCQIHHRINILRPSMTVVSWWCGDGDGGQCDRHDRKRPIHQTLYHTLYIVTVGETVATFKNELISEMS